MQKALINFFLDRKIQLRVLTHFFFQLGTPQKRETFNFAFQACKGFMGTLKAKLEVALFLGVHNCKQKVWSVQKSSVRCRLLGPSGPKTGINQFGKEGNRHQEFFFLMYI